MEKKISIFMIIVALLGIFILSGCDQEDEAIPSPTPAEQETEDDAPEQLQQEEPIEEEHDSAELSGCSELPDKLIECEPFSCEFEHIMTGEMMTREIVGLVDGKCHYTESMPNDGTMDCEYSESIRKTIAQYYSDLETGSESTYTIDGEEVEDPLQEVMNRGDCTISGY